MFYGEGLLSLIIEMILKIFVSTTHVFYFCTSPGSSSMVPYRRGHVALPVLVAYIDGIIIIFVHCTCLMLCITCEMGTYPLTAHSCT